MKASQQPGPSLNWQPWRKKKLAAAVAASLATLSGCLMGLPASAATLYLDGGMTQTDDGTSNWGYVGDLIVGAGIGDGTAASYYVQTVDPGSVMFTGRMVVGDGTIGTVRVTGGAQLNLNGTINPSEVGLNSNGALLVSGTNFDGTISSTLSTKHDLGIGVNGVTGNVVVMDAGVMNVGGNINVGNGSLGTGNLIVDNGSVSANFIYAGITGNSTGNIIVSNGATVTATSGFAIAGTNGGSQYGSLFIGSSSNGNPSGAGTIVGDVNLTSAYGTLVFNHTDTNYTFSNTVTGNGRIRFWDGTTRLTGDLSGFNGSVTLAGGTLLVNTATAGNVGMYVNDGTTLGGTGNLGGITVDTGGTLAPGDGGIGTLTMSNLVFATGSTYEVQVNDGGNVAGTNNDRVLVSGNLYVDGGAVHVSAENGTDDGSTYTPGTTYTILSSGTAVIGTFDSVTDDFLFLDFTASYDATNAYITSQQVASVDDAAIAITPNQQSVAGTLEGLGSGNEIYDAVLTVSNEDQARRAYDTLSGYQHSDVQAAVPVLGRPFQQLISNRVNGQSQFLLGSAMGLNSGDEAVLEHGVWGEVYGTTGDIDSTANVAGTDYDTQGIAIGVDQQLNENVTIGASINYANSDIGGDGFSADADSYQAAVYAGWELQDIYLNGQLDFGKHQFDSSRQIVVGANTSIANADYDVDSYSLVVEGGKAFNVAESTTLTPFGGLSYTYLDREGFTETGAGAANLVVQDSSNDSIRSQLGVRLGHTFNTAGGKALEGMLSAAWVHEFGDTTSTMAASFSSAPGNVFRVDSVDLERERLALTTGLSGYVSDNTKISVSYMGEYASSDRHHGLFVRLRTTW